MTEPTRRTQPTDSALREVEDREVAFYAAQTASDVAALADIMSDDLQAFIHTTGKTDTKESYLDGVRRGTYAHGPISRIRGRTCLSGSSAVAIGVIDMTSMPPDRSPFSMRLLQTLVWTREGSRWRLTLRQATRLPL